MGSSNPALDVGGCVASAWKSGLFPEIHLSVWEWADKYRILSSEASAFPGLWRTDRTPYLREIMECLSPRHPCWKITVKKGAQLGFTDVGINWLLFIADVAQSACGVYMPTIETANNYVRTKLNPAIDSTKKVAGVIAEQKSRDGSGSTTRMKRFPGGFVVISGANSSAGLQMVSLRFLVKDELSEWPADAGGRGDPSQQVNARTDAYGPIRKIYQPSTPGTEGTCRISVEYDMSDQRRYYVPCPRCRNLIVLDWSRIQWHPRFRDQAVYRCQACDELIAGHEKDVMLMDEVGGGWAMWVPCWPDDETGEAPASYLSREDAIQWRSRDPGPRQPGFHISQLYSPFKSWATLLTEFREAERDESRMKAFTQQALGEPWREAGEAPDYEYLMLRREGYPVRVVPEGCLVITAGVDVQKTYLQYEVVGWGPRLESWSIDWGVCEGDTTTEVPWKALDEILQRPLAYGVGGSRSIDLTAVDAGYNTPFVYAYARSRERVICVKGVANPMAPLIGTPSSQEVMESGRKLHRGVQLWPIGDDQLKTRLMAWLRLKVPGEGEPQPIGWCHFSLNHDKEFFSQLTAEALVTRVVNGRERRDWVKTGKNEALDCRKMAMAAAAHPAVNLFGLTEEGWARLAELRGSPVPKKAEADDQQAKPTPNRVSPDKGRDWFGGRSTDRWF